MQCWTVLHRDKSSCQNTYAEVNAPLIETSAEPQPRNVKEIRGDAGRYEGMNSVADCSIINPWDISVQDANRMKVMHFM